MRYYQTLEDNGRTCSVGVGMKLLVSLCRSHISCPRSYLALLHLLPILLMLPAHCLHFRMVLRQQLLHLSQRPMPLARSCSETCRIFERSERNHQDHQKRRAFRAKGGHRIVQYWNLLFDCPARHDSWWSCRVWNETRKGRLAMFWYQTDWATPPRQRPW